jgi:hypothetical protein
MQKTPKRGPHRLYWERATSPPALFEQAFEILSSRDPQGFAINAPEQPQAEAAQAMPVFGFSE